MIISRLPMGGGGAKPGIKDGKGLVNLNIFTQQNEPEVKDGIWIKTNGSVDNILLTNDIFTSTLTKTIDDGYYESSFTNTVYNNELYISKYFNYVYEKKYGL